jgi:hypothetical protein
VYLPQRQVPSAYVWVIAKTTVPPSYVVAASRRELQSLDPALFVSYVAPLEGVIAFDAELVDVEPSIWQERRAVSDLRGERVTACSRGSLRRGYQSVRRRTREIGVRMAGGATAAQIWRWVLRQGMGPVAVGLVAGLVASLGMNRLLRSQLTGIEFYDPLTMFVAPVVLAIVGLLACRVPAQRAVRVDPVVALRRE